MNSVPVSFNNSKGIKLAGMIDLPDDENYQHTAIFAHCFTCSKDLKAIANIDSSLAGLGIATLRYDSSAIGESEGNFTQTNFTTQIDDFISAAKFLDMHYKSPELLIGHSLGGCVALFSSFDIPTAKCVATIGTPNEPANLAKKLQNTRLRSIQSGTGEAEIGGTRFKFKPEFFEDLEKYNLETRLKHMTLPYLVLHSPDDESAPLEEGLKLFANANQPKKFVSLDGIDHMMLKKEDAVYVGKLIAVWAKSYLKGD